MPTREHAMHVAFTQLCRRAGYKPWHSNNLTPKECHQLWIRLIRFRAHYGDLIEMYPYINGHLETLALTFEPYDAAA